MLVAACVALATSFNSPPNAAGPNPPAHSLKGRGLPDRGFTENHGQWSSKVKFMARTRAADVWVTDSSLVFSWKKDGQVYPVSMEFADASPKAAAHGADAMPGVSNFFLGRRSATGVKSYREARVDNLYRGIDLVLKLEDGKPRYDFLVHPGADPKQIRIRYHGAKDLAVQQGQVRYQTPFGNVSDRKLSADQEGTENPVAVCERTGKSGTVGFDLGRYRRDRTLVIDPVIYATYLGGQGAAGDNDSATGVASGSDGSIYALGVTQSSDFPTTSGALMSTLPGTTNLFIVSFAPSTYNVNYATYFGGDNTYSQDNASSIAVDGRDAAYICGNTGSDNLPVTDGSSFPTASNSMGFVAKLNSDGSLGYCKYLGDPVKGSGLLGIAVTPAGVAAVCGNDNNGGNYPIVNPLDNTSVWAVVSEIGTDGSLLFSSYFGGPNATYSTDPCAVALDGSGNIYVSAASYDGSYPTTAGAYQPAMSASGKDFIVTEINPATPAVVYATFVGGNVQVANSDCLAVDASGDAYIASGLIGSYTNTGDYPITPGAYSYYSAGNGNQTVVSKIAAGGASLVYSTVIGPPGNCNATGIAVDASGDALVMGLTFSGGFPLTNGTYQNSYGATFVFQLSPGGTSLLYSSYYGDYSTDPAGVCYDASGNAVITGSTGDNALGTTANAFEPNYVTSGSGMGFLTVLQMQELWYLHVPATATIGEVVSANLGISGLAPVSGSGYTINLSSDNAAASVPASVTIPPGQSTASFNITTSFVNAATAVHIKATDDSGSKTATLTVNPGIMTAVTVAPSSVVAGHSATGNLYFEGAVPVGASVSLQSNSPAAIVPASVTVTGSPTPFAITTAGVDSNTLVTISATVNGVTRTKTLTVEAATLSSVTSSSSVVGGNNSAGAVTLTGVAGPSGVVVSLSSNNSAASVPTSAPILPGNSSGPFTIATSPVSASTVATITASLDSITKTAKITVAPAILESISLSPASIAGGAASTGTLHFSPAPPIGATVALSSSSVAAYVPASVRITGSPATFQVIGADVPSPFSVNISATYNGVTHSTALTVLPLTITSVVCSPNSLVGGGTSAGTVNFDRPAPLGGVLIDLSSTSGAAQVQALVYAAPGAISATFSVITTAVASNTSATISAGAYGTSESTTVTIKAPTITALRVPSTITTNEVDSCTVVISSPAPPGGLTITLGSTNSGASVPGTVTISTGQTSMNFNVTGLAVTSPTSGNITATLNSATRSAPITVNK